LLVDVSCQNIGKNRFFFTASGAGSKGNGNFSTTWSTHYVFCIVDEAMHARRRKEKELAGSHVPHIFVMCLIPAHFAKHNIYLIIALPST